MSVQQLATGWMVWGSYLGRSKRLSSSPNHPDWLRGPLNFLLPTQWV